MKITALTILAGFIFSLCINNAVYGAASKKSAHKTTAHATTHKPAIKKPARAKAEKPEIPSPYSLAGRNFNHISSDAQLEADDADLYAQIFALQDVGNFKKANALITKLDDHRLMGHVLYQRYISKDYTSVYSELAEWMKAYADHPGAQKIYDLALRHKPRKGSIALTTPRPSRGMTTYHDYDSGQLAQPYMVDQRYTPRARDIMKAIDEALPDRPSVALRYLETEEAKTIFSPTTYDALRARIAEAFFYNEKVKEASSLAATGADRSGRDIPQAGWTAGLAAWKEGRYGDAAKHFESTATSPRASAWMASGGAFWAARAYLRSHQPQKVSYWLQRAAEHPRSFYGIIAVKALGLEQTRFNWSTPALTGKLVETLAALPAGKRALALMDADRPEGAEQELRQIDPANDLKLQEAMLALAHKAGIPTFEIRLGSGLQDPKGRLYDAALYPEAPWQPKGGYQMDKALVYAFIRQESRFDEDIKNKSSGATGLMQLLPSTARIIARKERLNFDPNQLQNPVINISLGQKYLLELLHDPIVSNNLFKLAVAYNAGPGKLSRWEKTVRYDNDPLLFIESIPVAETRIFVERVMTNYWIYRLKYNQNTDSLEKVASGEWPIYMSQDKRPSSESITLANAAR